VLKLGSESLPVEDVDLSIAGQLLFLLGGLALLIGPLMPWLELLGATSISASGLDRTDGEAILVIAFGFAVAVSAGISLWRRKAQTMMVPFFLGLTGAAMTLIYYHNLRSAIASIKLENHEIAVGQGLYLCLAGGLMICVGLIVSEYQRHERVTASCHP
jgi:low temperature requirement protein LtrA